MPISKNNLVLRLQGLGASKASIARHPLQLILSTSNGSLNLPHPPHLPHIPVHRRKWQEAPPQPHDERISAAPDLNGWL